MPLVTDSYACSSFFAFDDILGTKPGFCWKEADCWDLPELPGSNSIRATLPAIILWLTKIPVNLFYPLSL
jgi:hypothetical protein